MRVRWMVGAWIATIGAAVTFGACSSDESLTPAPSGGGGGPPVPQEDASAPDVKQDGPPMGDASSDALGDAPGDAPSDAPGDATTDAPDDAPGDAADDAPGDAPDDATGDAADDTTSDAADDAPGDATMVDDASSDAPDDATTQDGSADDGGADAGDGGADGGPIGAWAPVGGGFTGTPCFHGARVNVAGGYLAVCTTDQGAQLTTLDAGGNATSFAGIIPGAGTPAHHGRTLAAHLGGSMSSLYASEGGVFRNDGTLVPLPAASDADPWSAGLQAQLGNIAGGYGTASGAASQGAIVLSVKGSGSFGQPYAVSTATGTVRWLQTSPNAGDLVYAAVFGETPSGTPATGGVFSSTDLHTWTAFSAGIDPNDLDRVFAIAASVDRATLFVGVRGPGRLYRVQPAMSSTWVMKNIGLPVGVDVLSVAVSPSDANVVWVGTASGIYQSTDNGDQFNPAGLSGRAVRAIAPHPSVASKAWAGTDETDGLYVSQ